MDLNRELERMARNAGICGEWGDMLHRTKDREAMVRMYLDGILFCMKNDYPPVGLIKERFGDICEANGIFIDRAVSRENARQTVILGNCTGRVLFTGYSAGVVYLTHGSRITVEASGNAFVEVDVFGEAEVTLIAKDTAKIRCNRYGGKVETITPSTLAKIRIRERNR